MWKEMKISFTKMQGAGNDYVYINAADIDVPDGEMPELVRKLSDRHFGIGGDGVIVIAKGHTPIGRDAENGQKRGDPAQFEMIMYNQDGSRGEMCGNGIRCVGKYVYDHDMIPGVDRSENEPVTVTIESAGMVKYLRLYPEDGAVKTARVDMGEPVLHAADVPVDTGILKANKKTVMSAGMSPSAAGTEESACAAASSSGKTEDAAAAVASPLEVLGRTYSVTAVSMGNPHAVVFAEELDLPDGDLWKWDITKLGPAFENHPAFPRRVNTEFVKVLDREHAEMRVWERGSGETLACGTGCCAAAVACVLNGRTERKLEVRVAGGTLLIEWDEETGHVFMTGPAVTVFEGTVDTEDL